jgi:hypothetical protein
MKDNKQKEKQRLYVIASQLHDIEVELFDRAGNKFDEMIASHLRDARKRLEEITEGELHA